MKRKDHYKKQSKLYSEFAENSFSWKYIEKPALDKHLKPIFEKDLLVLDVGCGAGRIIKYLLQKGISPNHLIGIDSSKEMLSFARRKFPSIKFIHGDVSKSDTFPRLSFDLITCIMTLQHLDQKGLKNTLKNFYGRLRKGGVLLCLIPHPTRMTHEDLSKYFKREELLYESPWNTKIHYFHRPLSDYIKETLHAGFTIQTVDEPEIIKQGRGNSKDYKKYSSYPSRLLILARK